MAECEEDLKSLLLSVKVDLKLNTKTTHGNRPHHSLQIEGEVVEVVTEFTFLGSQITADCYSSHEIKRRLLLGRKTMPNLNSMIKSIDISLPIKVRMVKAMVFPVVSDYKDGRAPKNRII
ncbi:uncharacterized protein LOC106664974 [Cimex lectularius]|uniref:Uncharacterized protein n=1 Tax=Cimex lectularius TaxID=79782 RepID=A0A8I6RR14_CIMLE|nr:uncharacterized protein LOC106664974 [Cimex lectularius]